MPLHGTIYVIMEMWTFQQLEEACFICLLKSCSKLKMMLFA
uniref:Uncharacterized protein n=1 Tax=Arundo donax TaxID=35708 RepID=A0A0A9ED10_ARUDO